MTASSPSAYQAYARVGPRERRRLSGHPDAPLRSSARWSRNASAARYSLTSRSIIASRRS